MTIFFGRRLAWRKTLFAGIAAVGATATADPVTVQVDNESTVTTCAEEDNVNYVFRAANGMRGFKIAAGLPDYMATIVQDYAAPDYSNCPDTPPPPPATHYTPPPIVLYQDKQIQLRGLVDPRFWRPHKAIVRVDQLDWPFLDLVQLWKNTPSGYVEFMVFYPQDGYWRIKGLPPRRFAELAYGSSFLLGPMEDLKTRPYADYKRVTFDWKTLSFTIEFARGGKAVVQVSGLGDDSTAEVSVRFDPALPAGTPFASLRSMYVAPSNHDTEHVTTRTAPGAEPVRTPVMSFTRAQVNDIAFGRSELSKHNISAPDMRFLILGTRRFSQPASKRHSATPASF